MSTNSTYCHSPPHFSQKIHRNFQKTFEMEADSQNYSNYATRVEVGPGDMSPKPSRRIIGSTTTRRSQVKVACVACRKACKKCDEVRPCTRCSNAGLGSQCVDAPRRDRKKYKKKSDMPQARSVHEQFDKSTARSNNMNIMIPPPHRTLPPLYLTRPY